MAQRKLRSATCVCGHDKDYHQGSVKTRFRKDAMCGGSQQCRCLCWRDKLGQIDPNIVAMTMPQLRRELVHLTVRQADIEYVLEAKTVRRRQKCSHSWSPWYSQNKPGHEWGRRDEWEERNCSSCGKRQTR